MNEPTGTFVKGTPALAITTVLAALVQSIAHLELEEGFHQDPVAAEIEILIENRFIAARDTAEFRALAATP